MEFAKFGSVEEWIQNRGKLTEVEARFVLKSVLSGLEYLHVMGVVHCDIKPSNLMICEGLKVKVCDLGLAQKMNGRSFVSGRVGTVAFMSPEMIIHRKFGLATDVWSSACTLIRCFEQRTAVLVQGEPVPTHEELVDRLSNSEIELPDVSEDCKTLLKKMLEKSHGKRITPSTALQHCFFTNNYCPTTLPEKCLREPPSEDDFKRWERMSMWEIKNVRLQGTSGEEVRGVVRTALARFSLSDDMFQVCSVIRKQSGKYTIIIRVHSENVMPISFDGNNLSLVMVPFVEGLSTSAATSTHIEQNMTPKRSADEGVTCVTCPMRTPLSSAHACQSCSKVGPYCTECAVKHFRAKHEVVSWEIAECARDFAPRLVATTRSIDMKTQTIIKFLHQKNREVHARIENLAILQGTAPTTHLQKALEEEIEKERAKFRTMHVVIDGEPVPVDALPMPDSSED